MEYFKLNIVEFVPPGSLTCISKVMLVLIL